MYLLILLSLGALLASGAKTLQATEGWVAAPGACLETDGLCGSGEAACQTWADYRSIGTGQLFGTYWVSGAVLPKLACQTEYFIDDFTTLRCDAGRVPCEASEGAGNAGCCVIDPDNRCPTSGNPISLVEGNKFESVTDFATAGPNRLAFTRFYNSASKGVSLMGIGWRSSFDQVLQSRFGGYERWLTTADGRIEGFGDCPGNCTPDNRDAGLSLQQVGADFELTYPDDSKEIYHTNGRLLSIEKRGGYSQTLNYDGSGNLLDVTDSDGRQLSFTMANDRITSMTDPDGNTYSYVYANVRAGAQDRLDEVIHPDDTPADPNDNPKTTYLYEDPRYSGALTGILDEKGVRYASWTYDADFRAISSEHAGGAERVDIVYDMPSGTRTVTNALGKQTVYRFQSVAGRDRLVETEGLPTGSCAGSMSLRSYDSHGFADLTTDREGNVTDTDYDIAGLMLRKVEAVGQPEERTTNYLYQDPAGLRQPTRIERPGLTRDMVYDSQGNLITLTLTDTTIRNLPYSTNGETRSWSYGYTPEGYLATVDGPRSGASDTTSYGYDLSGNLISVTTPTGQVTQVTAHNSRGLPLTLEDANDVVTQLAYDPRGRLISRTVEPGPNAAVTLYEYDAVGQVTAVTLPDGSRLDYVYDDARRLVEIANSLGEKIVYTLDALGNRTKEEIFSASSLIQKTQSRVFDEIGRLLQDVGAAQQTTDYGYDLNDNLISVIDPVSAATDHAYDGLNRLVSQTDDLLGETSYAYDARDNLTAVTDPLGQETRYSYNGFGDVIQLDSPDTGLTVYHLDSAGNRIRRTDARGAVTEFDYDAENRLTARRYPANPSADVAYGYDDPTPGRFGKGRLTSITDGSGWSELHYDSHGKLALEQRNIGGLTYETSYAYDSADRLIEMVYPSGRIVSYQRDALGRVTTVTTQADEFALPVTLVDNIDHLPFGPLAGLDYGNGLALDLTYDQDYRLTGQATTGLPTALQDLTYGYDPASDITAITDLLDAGRNQSFIYDSLHRLTQSTGVYGQIDDLYDALGNRTDRTLVDSSGTLNETYVTDPLSSRLLSVDDGSNQRNLAYSLMGATTRDQRADGTLFDLGYNLEGRLVAVAKNSAPEANYRFNAEGERVAKIAAGRRSHSLYGLSGGLLAEYDAGAASPVAGPAETAIQLDNGAPGTAAAGVWLAGTDPGGFFGADFLGNTGGAADSYSWTPSLPESGAYDVYARWPQLGGRGGTVTYSVSHDGGATPVPMDQQALGGPWHLLGRFDMTPGLGHGVELSGESQPIAAEREIIIDNDDPAASAQGIWTYSTWEPGQLYNGAAYMQYAGTGATSYSWQAAVPEAGLYKVYARWSEHANRASDATYSVHHAGGMTPVIVNQEVNGGEWVLLGAFDLDPAAGHKVVLSDAANERVIADAVKFLRDAGSAPAAELVIDDSHPGTSSVGSWSNTVWTGTQLYNGAAKSHVAGAGSDSFTWPAAVPTAGLYKVYGRWTAHSSRASDALYTVQHAGGSTPVTVNQRINGGQWVLLGSFDLDPAAGHQVVLSQAAGGSVVADALKFLRDAGSAAAPELVLDDQDPGTTVSGSWTASGSTAGGTPWNGSFRTSDPGPAASVTWTPSLPIAGRWRLYARWSDGAGRASDAPYTVHHAGGTSLVAIDQRVNGGHWMLLGSFDLAPGAGHKVVLDNQANGRVAADAIRLELETGGRLVAADAVRLVKLAGLGAADAAFQATASSLTREYITLGSVPLATVEAGQIAWVHTDHLGTPQKMSDATGALVWDRQQRPFGADHALTGTANNPQRFPGQVYDPETGYHYNYFRDYDPSLGRYLQSDPIGLRGGVNTYLYARGNSLRYTDPTGEFPYGFGQDIVDAILSGLGGSSPGGQSAPPGDSQNEENQNNNSCSAGDPDNDCFEAYVKCKLSSLADQFGSVFGEHACETCREACLRDGAWPNLVPKTRGWIRCDYWNFPGVPE